MYAVFEWLCGGFYKYQNLRTRYKAEWALVTGASSGGVTKDGFFLVLLTSLLAAAIDSVPTPSIRGPSKLPPSNSLPVVCYVTPGIGKAVAKRLADQGLNVVLVALPDDTLETTYEQLVADYPGVQFRKVRRP